MKEHIFLSSPHMSEEGYEKQYIQEAFDTNWIAPLGKNVTEFENEMQKKLGAKATVALSAGTAAIHMALKAIGIGQGDIVFCQSLTFAATANPITYEKAVPVFIDSEEDTWNMSPSALQKAFVYEGPFIIDCRIDKDECVFPMLPPGGSMDDIIVKIGE